MASLNSKPCVLIVDDDDAVRDSLDAYLTLKGMQVTAFSSAKETLNHTGSCVDIVILDVNMPDINGFALLSMLRGQGQLAPAIFITGLGDPEMRIRAERAGVAAILDKPIDPLALLATLNRLLT